jgi:tRNA A22 N-methylase
MGDYDGGPNIRTVADVGTDHGLLAMGLALSNRFDKVVGVDVSQQALQDGALALLDTVKDQRLLANKGEIRSPPAHDGSQIMKEIPVEFRQSDGLKNIQAGEADAVCIAGMGVNTMLQILLDEESSTSSNDDEGILNHLARIDCQQLILQPTNSRPRNLILLYDRLQESGWCLVDERIEELASRWYITACFLRSKPNDNTRGNNIMDLQLPTSRLVVSLDPSNSMRRAYEDYVEHHLQWIEMDTAARGTINDADKRWLTQQER